MSSINALNEQISSIQVHGTFYVVMRQILVLLGLITFCWRYNMRKISYLLLLTILLLLTACVGQTGINEKAVPASAKASNEMTIDTGSVKGLNTVGVLDKASADQSDQAVNIQVKTPMTISDNLIEYKGTSAYLRLKMISGTYCEDWTPGAIMGTIWKGRFILDLCDEYGESLAQAELSKYYTEELTFTESFDLAFDDYNNDGNIDFTLGQYASSNGRLYKLFTIKADGTIEPLEIKDIPELFISDSTDRYSTKLYKCDNTSFKVRYYDNSQSKTYETIYKWKDGKFIGLDKREAVS